MFKPLLAPNNDPLKDSEYWSRLKYPLLVSPKLDGIRVTIKDCSCKSRTNLDIPSIWAQTAFSLFSELDGEIIIGNETDFDVYLRTYSYIMSIDKEPVDFKMHFRVFDCADESIRNEPFDYRLMHAERLLKEYQTELTLPKFAATSIIEHKLVYTLEDLLAYESLCLAAGYEGIMLRDPKGRYKHGRATVNEGLIYKLKRFQDAEAVVTGLEEAQRNENVLETDAQGYAKRSTAKAGLIGSDTLGRLIVDYDGQELKLSPGALKHDERQRIWDNPNEYLGKIAKFRFFAHGVKDKPRFPRFVGWRSKTDM